MNPDSEKIKKVLIEVGVTDDNYTGSVTINYKNGHPGDIQKKHKWQGGNNDKNAKLVRVGN